MSLALLGLGCLNVFSIGAQDGARDGGSRDGGRDPLTDGGTFGEWAAQVGAAPCAAGAVLVVDTVEDELDAGGDFSTLATRAEAGLHLSFREALWLAHNTAGPKSVVFDEGVFPTKAPGVMTIASPGLPWGVRDVCLDGRGRGVIVRWDNCFAPSCVWGFDSKSRMLGLTLEGLPQAMNVPGEVAACRLSGSGRMLNLQGAAVVGPGVIFGPCQVGLQAETPTLSQHSVKGSYFGFDPLTNQLLPVQVDMYLFAATDVRDSEFHSVTYLTADSQQQQSVSRLTDNVYQDAQLFAVGGNWLFAHNTVRGSGSISVTRSASLELRQNSISGAVFIASPVPAPTLIGYANGMLTGTCPLDGHVEVFTDPGNLGEIFVTETDCVAGAGFSVALQVVAGLNLTATLTVPSQGTSGFSNPLTP